MFSQIARHYDLLNTLMTFGLDAGWRRRAVAEARVPPRGVALDVGTGTGALAVALAAGAPAGCVIGLDFAAPMLQRAPGRATRTRSSARVGFVLGDALRLPFSDRTFDCVTSAFTIRNVADRHQAFAEQVRVLKPGGRVVCLELTRTRWPLFRYLFGWYFHRWVPLLGAWIARNPAAYAYLPESVDQFPEPELLATVMRHAGLVAVRYTRLGLGTVALHVGVRPSEPNERQAGG
jgi:demethylmenaquinone methyltransferase/2-methoxy-6-polyprenyl-1,4-benzoquinol methylase